MDTFSGLLKLKDSKEPFANSIYNDIMQNGFKLL